MDSKGNTIYDTVWVNSSPYLKNIANLDDENEIFTYILLTNNAFEQAFNAYRPYSKMPIAQQWDSLTAYNVCSDLAIKGKYNLNNLPDTLISTNGIKVNIDKQSIIKTADLSNGAVIMLDKYPVQLKNKVKPIILEGENPVGRSFTPKKDTTFRSVVKRYDPMASGGYDLIYNFSSGSAFWVQFTANNIFSAKYKFYWVAPNYIYNLKNKITGTPNAVVDTVINYFNQVLSVNPYNSNTALFTFGQALTTANYTETYIGEYTFAAFANAVSLRVSGVTIKALPSPPTTATASPSFATAVSVDYIKMVPVIQ